MKKQCLVMMMAIISVLTVAMMQAPQVNAEPSAVYVQGVVRKDGKPVGVGKEVIIRCTDTKGVEGFAGQAYTDSKGFYSVHTNTEKCPLGTQVLAMHVTGIYGEHDASTIGIVEFTTTIDLSIGTIYPIPEYGWTGGVVALAAGGGALLVARRKLGLQ